MKTDREKIKVLAQEAINQEAAAVKNLASFIDDQFLDAVELIYNCKGRLIITGIPKGK